VKVVGADRVVPTMAPRLGEHTDDVLADVLGFDAGRIAALRDAKTVL
jgi:crotonobetainyl-CoA:carnitine CoA-transferase CaiB-like acyl-CoA transferase